MRMIDADKLRTKAVVDVDSGEPFIGLQELDEAPTVDAVEVVHGWTEVIEPFNVTLTTRCGLCCVAMGNLDNFCPNCGAKMDGERKNND